MATITGTTGDDTLVGTSVSDTIDGLGGNDTITDTLGGSDTIYGGDGDDVITVIRGNGITGGPTIYGDAGADIIRLIGTAGNVTGGDGNDQVYITASGSAGTIDLGAGNDLVSRVDRFADPYGMYVTTGSGQDAIGGSCLIWDFTVGDGGDRLLWNESLALLTTWDQSTNPFASGHMRFVPAGPNYAVQVFTNEWKPFVYLIDINAAGMTTFNLGGYALDGSAPVSQNLVGAGGNDRLEGDVGNDTINGGAGNDTLLGGIGNDVINGEGDDDVIDGGLGTDTIDGGLGNDTITDHYGYQGTIAGGGGNDTITVDLTVVSQQFNQPAAPPRFQRTIDGGDGNDTIRFISFQSVVNGGPNFSGATLNGGSGDDYIETNSHKVTIDGGSGHDTIVVGPDALVTLGADSDILRLNGPFQGGYLVITVTDFQAGAGGDVLDLPNFLLISPLNWNYEGNPFASGEYRLVTSGADVLVQGITNHFNPTYATFLILQNTNIAALTAENFGGYAPDGSPPPGQTINGTPGPDVLTGGIGDDTISGLGDNDTLNGGFGNDHLIGGEGNDTIEDHWGGGTFEGGEGNDTIVFTKWALAEEPIVVAILGGGGNDTINALGVTGAIDAGGGNDVVSVGSYTGTIALGDGNDTLTGIASFTTIDLGAGDDLMVLKGFSVSGNTGNITLGAGRDTLIAVRGDSSVEILDFQVGEEGDRLDLTAWGANSFFNNTLIISQVGADTRIDGAMVGTSYLLRNVVASDLSTYNLGIATGFFNPAARTYEGTPGPDTYVSGDGNDTIRGNGDNDVLYGAGGNDQIDGGAGNDTLIGGTGVDQMAGGSGDDNYYVDNHSDVVLESVGNGRDVVYSTVNYELTPGSEIEVLSSDNQGATNALELVGNAFNQDIYGNAGANLLEGGGGTDYLVGLGGDDYYIVNGNSDHVVESAGGGRDVVYTRGDYVLDPNVFVEILSTANQAATTAINLIGSTGDQEIYGNAGVNHIEGGGGTDWLGGLGGNDVYVVVGSGDHVLEAIGGGSRDVVYAKASYTLEANQEVEVLSTANQSASTAMNLTGNNLVNEVYGNNGANTLNGGGGSDFLMGFGGADTFAFTTALGASNVDQILDFNAADDTIALDDAVFAGLATGALAASAFVNGTAAADADDRILYNSATGQILFDADGNGAGAAVLFATVSAGTVLTASDFMVI